MITVKENHMGRMAQRRRNCTLKLDIVWYCIVLQKGYWYVN